MGVFRCWRVGLPQEDEAEELGEGHCGQPSCERQGRERQTGGPGFAAREGGEQAPVEEPFAEEGVEGGQGRHCQDRRKDHQRGAGHPLGETPQGLDLPGARGVQQGTGSEEQ